MLFEMLLKMLKDVLSYFPFDAPGARHARNDDAPRRAPAALCFAARVVFGSPGLGRECMPCAAERTSTT